MRAKLKYNLDITRSGRQVKIDVYQGDTASRIVLFTLTNGTEPFDISDADIAVLYAEKPDGTKVMNGCSMTADGIEAVITTQMTQCEGNVHCQLVLQSEREIIASPEFIIDVMKRDSFPVYTLLQEKPDNWEQNYNVYYEKDKDGFLTNVTGSANATPTWKQDTYYKLTNPYAESENEYGALLTALSEAKKAYESSIEKVVLNENNQLIVTYRNGSVYVSSSLKGNVGPQGEIGPQGPIGLTGPQGEQGEKGEQGPQGERGEIGPQGEMGPQGPAGKDGQGLVLSGSYDDEQTFMAEHTEGKAGEAYLVGGDLYIWLETENCWENAGGIQGPKGDTGPQGIQGEQGPKGDTGPVGETGPIGPKGESFRATIVSTLPSSGEENKLYLKAASGAEEYGHSYEKSMYVPKTKQETDMYTVWQNVDGPAYVYTAQTVPKVGDMTYYGDAYPNPSTLSPYSKVAAVSDDGMTLTLTCGDTSTFLTTRTITLTNHKDIPTMGYERIGEKPWRILLDFTADSGSSKNQITVNQDIEGKSFSISEIEIYFNFTSRGSGDTDYADRFFLTGNGSTLSNSANYLYQFTPTGTTYIGGYGSLRMNKNPIVDGWSGMAAYGTARRSGNYATETAAAYNFADIGDLTRFTIYGTNSASSSTVAKPFYTGARFVVRGR